MKSIENDYQSDEEQISKAKDKMRRDVNQAIEQRIEL